MCNYVVSELSLVIRLMCNYVVSELSLVIRLTRLDIVYPNRLAHVVLLDLIKQLVS